MLVNQAFLLRILFSLLPLSLIFYLHLKQFIYHLLYQEYMQGDSVFHNDI